MKRPPSKKRGKALRSFPFENNKIDFTKFKSDPTAADIVKLTLPGVGIKVWPFVPIEVLSPIKTVGRGRTNLTLVSPTILQTDATTPYAGFGQGDGTVSVHFEPIAYGITSVATYIMVFSIQTFGSANFTLSRQSAKCWHQKLEWVGVGGTDNERRAAVPADIRLLAASLWWPVELVLHSNQVPRHRGYSALVSPARSDKTKPNVRYWPKADMGDLRNQCRYWV